MNKKSKCNSDWLKSSEAYESVKAIPEVVDWGVTVLWVVSVTVLTDSVDWVDAEVVD